MESNILDKIVARLESKLSLSISQMDVAKSQKIIRICKKMRDLRCGDLVLPAGCIVLGEEQQNKLGPQIHGDDILAWKLLESLIQFCKDDSGHAYYVSKIAKDKHSLLAFYLDRGKFCKAVFKEIQERKSQYGHAFVPEGKSVYISCVPERCFSDGTSLTDLRVRVVFCHVRKLLHARGISVHSKALSDDLGDLLINRETAAEEQAVKLFETAARESSSALEKNYIDKAKHLSLKQNTQSLDHCKDQLNSDSGKRISGKEVHSVSPECVSMDRAELDLQMIIKERGLFWGKNGFDKNLHKITVVSDGKATKLLQDVAKLAHRLQTESDLQVMEGCLHLVPQHLSFRQQQIQLTLDAISHINIHQSQLVVGPVTSKGNSSSGSCEVVATAEQFYRTRYQQMKEASEMRNSGCVEDEDLEKRVNLLTSVSIKLDILGNAAHSPLCLDISCNDRGAEARLGAFVVYNTARLATLMEHFTRGVDKGLYPELPAVEDVDFTLLREQEDWELVYLYIAAFPDILQQAVEVIFPPEGKLLAKIHTHKVANFLAPFCKCLSAHYSRYHILTSGEPHLLPLMYARLYLMKSAHQVLLNCLDLLGVEALSYL